MVNLFTKFVFLLKRPKVIVVAGDYKDATCGAIFDVLNSGFRVKKISKISAKNIWQNQVLILPFTDKDEDKKNLLFFIKKSKMPILVVANIGEIPDDKIFFAGDKEKVKSIIEIAKNLPNYGKLIFCFDDETVREIQDCVNCDCLSFGFGQKANCCASDVKTDEGVNFKINYKGNIVPVWLEEFSGKKMIYNALAATGCGIVLGMNLVEISQILKKHL